MNLSLAGTFRDKTFIYPVRVYYSDTDAGGVVYHARYLDFAEHARSEMLRSLGGDQEAMLTESGSVFVVRSITADYIRPGRLDELLTVETRIERAARIIVIFSQNIMRGDELLCTLQVKAGFVSMRTGSPVRMPETWQEAIGALVQER